MMVRRGQGGGRVMTRSPQIRCPRCGRPMGTILIFDPFTDACSGKVCVRVHLRCNRCNIIELRVMRYSMMEFERLEESGILMEVIDRDLTALLEREPMEGPSVWRRLVNRPRGRARWHRSRSTRTRSWTSSWTDRCAPATSPGSCSTTSPTPRRSRASAPPCGDSPAGGCSMWRTGPSARPGAGG